MCAAAEAAIFGEEQEKEHEILPETALGSTALELASERKLNFFGIDLEIETSAEEKKEESDCYFFIQKSCLQDIFKQALCPKCSTSSLTT